MSPFLTHYGGKHTIVESDRREGVWYFAADEQNHIKVLIRTGIAVVDICVQALQETTGKELHDERRFGTKRNIS